MDVTQFLLFLNRAHAYNEQFYAKAYYSFKSSDAQATPPIEF